MKKGRRDAGRPRGEPIKNATLDQAVEELALHGWEGFSIERVAAGAGLNKTSIYRRWGTREALVAAALGRVRDDLSVRLVDHGSLREDLLALAKDVAAVATSPTGKAVLQAAFSAHGTAELERVATAALQEASTAPALALVARARRRREWRRGLDPAPVLTMLMGAIVHRAMLEHAVVDARWLTSVVDVIVRGVAPSVRRAGASRR